MANLKKLIYAQKAEVSKAKNLRAKNFRAKNCRAKNLGISLELFCIFETRENFIKLRKAFIKAAILNNFNPKCYIQIVTDLSRYDIDTILGQLTLDNSG